VPGARSALIVATYAYDDAAGLNALRAPRQDAEALSQVLGDPEVGGFDVRTVVNQPAHVVNLEVARFFANRRPDDLLLLHFSCHGVKDDAGELYFAATDTRLDLLEASAVSAAFVNKVMDRSRSSRVVLLLDCCYAGAFARGMSSRGGPGLDLQERLAGRGRAVITASTSLQFAFEDGDLADGDAEERPSVFTRSLVEGLTSGEADRDQDGIIGLDELYGFVYDAVTAATPNQTPGKWAFGLEGDLQIAHRRTPVTVPSSLGPEVEESLASSIPWHRESVIPELERVLRGSHPGRALAARLALERLCDDDSRQVATHALTVLTAFPRQRTAPAAAAPVPAPVGDPLTDFVSMPVHEEPPAPEPVQPEAVQREPVQPEPVPVQREPARPEPTAGEPPKHVPAAEPELGGREPLDLEPVDLEPPSGGRPLFADEPLPAEVTAVRPVPPPDTRADKGSRRWWPVAAAVVAALVAGGAWWVLSSSGNDAGRAVTKASATLPANVLLLARPHGDVIHLVEVDSRTGKVLPGAPSPPGRLPTVSPKRDAVAYVAGDRALAVPAGADGWEPYVASADFKHQRALLPPSSRTRNCSFAGRAAWRPDRDDLMVLPCRDTHGVVTGLQRVTSSGHLVGHEKLVPGMTGDPTWSADGKVIFARTVNGRSRILQLPDDLSGKPVRRFAAPDGAVSDFAPDWSPRGLLFLRAADAPSGGGVLPGTVMVAPDGGTPRPVEGAPTQVYTPTWSQDEKAIAYLLPTKTRGSVTLGIFDRATGKLQTTSLSGPIGAPAWGSR
jgi:hypothetical protein